MARKNFSLIVKMLVAIMTIGMYSCSPDDHLATVEMTNGGSTPTPVVVSDWHLFWNDSVQENVVDYTITAVDSTTMEKHRFGGNAELYCEEYDYTIEEKDELLDVKKANETMVIGEPELLPTDSGYVAVTKAVAEMGDGNIIHIVDSCESVNGVPGYRLSKVEILSLANVVKTRAAMYEKKRHNTEIVARLTYEAVGVEGVPAETVVLNDMVLRRVLAEDEIDHADALEVEREIIDATSERCSFTERYTMKSGDRNDIKRNFLLNREFAGIPPYELTLKESFDYRFYQSYGVAPGTEYPIESSEDNLRKWEVIDNYAAAINGEIPVNTRYTLKHQRCTYTDKWVNVEWGFLPVEVSELETTVSGATSDRDGYDKAILTNNIGTVYGGYTQNLSEYVNLYKLANTVVEEGWETESETHSFTNTTQTCAINYYERYRNGEIVRTPFRHTFSREYMCVSEFVSIEQNSSAQTDGARIVNPTSENKKDNEWTWVEERGSITANVTLAGSKQVDRWTYKEANSIKVTYKGKTHSFRVGTYEMQNSAAVGSGVEKGDYTEYPYSDVLSYKFSTADVKQATAPGVIKVEIEEERFFPPYMGELKSVTETVAPSADRKTYVYTWSLHFTEGTMVAVIPRGSLQPEWHFESFITNTDSRFNGGYYTKATQSWINTIANDGKDWMEWLDESGSNKGNMAYSTGTAWGWDEGHQVSGHPSVFTSRHRFTVTNGMLKVYDTYLNQNMKDDHVNKHGGWK